MSAVFTDNMVKRAISMVNAKKIAKQTVFTRLSARLLTEGELNGSNRMMTMPAVHKSSYYDSPSLEFSFAGTTLHWDWKDIPFHLVDYVFTYRLLDRELKEIPSNVQISEYIKEVTKTMSWIVSEILKDLWEQIKLDVASKKIIYKKWINATSFWNRVLKNYQQN